VLTKGEIKSALLKYSGITGYKWRNLPNGLYCFNYHRIGDADTTEYDPNVFSCSAINFDIQLTFYKENFSVITLAQALELITANKRLDKKYALITFDDGYIDNYTVAMPILIKHGLSAVFHLPSDYIESDIIPWWDEIAYMLKHTHKVELNFGDYPTVNLTRFKISKTIRLVMNNVKHDPRSMDIKVEELRQKLVCKINTDNEAVNMFVNWKQVQEMAGKGMYIGSHTRSHRILSHLSVQDQTQEMRLSKEVIEAKIGMPVVSVAYPVGNKKSFTEVTCELAKSIGYQCAFSFISGHNKLVNPEDNFHLKRIGIDGNASIDDIKKKVSSYT
jgi:peptidoglycan/xylan/chitin deacetylase (PgdA/CDA1 family)